MVIFTLRLNKSFKEYKWKEKFLFLNERNLATLVKALSFLLAFEQILDKCLWNFRLFSNVIPSLTSLLSQTISVWFCPRLFFLFPDFKRYLSVLAYSKKLVPILFVKGLSIIQICHVTFAKWKFDIHNLLKTWISITYLKFGFSLNITKVKYTINFQIIPFMVQNKTQIGYNTHRYKKVVKKILTWKSNHTYTLIYQKISHVTFLIKKWTYKENWASSTPEQVWTALLSLLHHCSIYVSVSSPNKTFYKHNFLKKSMITLPSEFFVTA